MIIEDILPVGLNLNQNSIKLYYINDIDNIDLNDYVTFPESCLTISKDTQMLEERDKFTLNLTSEYEKFKNCEYVVVYYTATMNDNDELLGGIENTAWYTYSRYPYTNVPPVTVDDTAEVKACALEVYKYFGNINSNPEPLADAVFTLYRKALVQEIHTNVANLETIKVNNSDVNVIKIKDNIKTGDDGFAKLEGLSPAADYYLVETSAPSGYKLDSTPKEIKLVNHSEDTGYTTRINIENKKATLTLPTTGDTGMIMLTMLGLTAMVAAILLVAISYKKKDSHN